MTTIQKIAEIEAEMARTQKNKATAYHLGLLKAKLAKLKQEIINPSKGGGGGKPGEGFDVTKSGDARVGLIGFPSVGKSTLLTRLTGTESAVAAYEFTTLTCMAEDAEVLTDRGFLSRAEVFAACPALAPALPTAAPASDNDSLPFGGAVLSRTVSPLFWAPSAAEMKADEAAGIRYEQLSAAGDSMVRLRDEAGRYGCHCGVCSTRVWGSSKGSANTLMYQHTRSKHAAEVARAAEAAEGRRSGAVTSAISAASVPSTPSCSTTTSRCLPAYSTGSCCVSTPVRQVAATESARPPSPPPLLFASLDPLTGHLVYLPATAITYQLVSSLVEFTSAAEAPSWASDADEYGLTPAEVQRMKARSDRARAGEKLEEEDKHRAEQLSNGVSLLVDRQHDMYARVGLLSSYNTTSSDIEWADDYVKVKAGSLLSDSARQRVRMTGQATAGFDASAVTDDQLPFIAALQLSNAGEIDTFLWLYGYWIGDGFLVAQQYYRGIGFTPKKDGDKKEVKKRLEALGFTVPSASVHVYDNADGGRTFEVTDRRWVDYFFGEYGPKYGAASVSSSRPHTHTGLTTPLPTSVKWFWVWVWRLRKARARLVLAGLRFADGQEAADRQVIFTSGVHFRDDIVRLALHAGYAARFDVHYKKGDHRGYRDDGGEIIAQHDGWKVAYSDCPQAAEPILHNHRDVKAVEASSAAPVPVWCVTVPPHHLIIARRVRRNASGVVLQASKPIVVGNCIPGSFKYKGCKIQLLDLPGIIEGAKDGKGRGRQVIAVARTCNLILIVLDAAKPMTHKRIIEKELEGFGIRLNERPPQIVFNRKERGGINITYAVPCTKLDNRMITNICKEYKIVSADITLREDASVDQLIDVIEGNRKYCGCLYVLNKIDAITIEELELLSRVPHYVPIAANLEWNFDDLLEQVWSYLNMKRIYTKPKGQIPDYDAPVVVPADKCTVEQFCLRIHKSLLQQFKHALVWGKSVKHTPQKVGKEHELQDEDVVQIVKKV